MARSQDEDLVVIGAGGQRRGGLELLDVTYLRFRPSGKLASVLTHWRLL